MKEPIKNIINYDPTLLAHECEQLWKKFEADPRWKQIEKKADFSIRLIKFPMVFGSVMAVAFFVLFRLGLVNQLICTIGVFSAVVIATSGLFLLAVQPRTYSRLQANRDSLYQDYFSPAHQFQNWVEGENVVAAYGEPVCDDKFAVTIVIEDDADESDTGKTTLKETIIFNFDSSKEEGALTLDVGNGVVFRA